MPSIAENKHRKRCNILDAALELFTSKSVSETAIDDVVKLAGVAKGTFYLYFRDKYDLLDQIVLYRTADIFTDAYKKLLVINKHSVMNIPEQFIFVADYITDYLKKNKKVTALIAGRLSVCFSDKGYSMNSTLKDVHEYFTSLITDLNYSKEEAQKRLFIIIDMISSVSCDAILSEKPFTLDEIMPSVYDVLNLILSEVKSVDNK